MCMWRSATLYVDVVPCARERELYTEVVIKTHKELSHKFRKHTCKITATHNFMNCVAIELAIRLS